MKISYSGVDIGGANIKVYRGDSGDIEIYYFPMWRKWGELEEFLRGLDLRGKVGVALTAELADAFPSKAEGVQYIAGIARSVFQDTVFIDVDGNIKTEIDEPEKFAANNWVASVKFLSTLFDDFIFTDMGSTTTDIIPVKKGKILAGKTDFERLNRNELLYFGMLRTPSFFLINENCSSELFSITADAMLLAGLIDEKDYTCDTPDGRGRRERECMQRLARQFCADLDELGDEFVRRIALKIKDEMVGRVEAVLREKSEKYGIVRVVGCGIGELLLREASERVGLKYTSLQEEFGDVSKAFPAYAIAKLAERYDRG